MNSPNTDGMKNRPSSAALATTRHLTSAEIVCVSNASKIIQTRLAISIAYAIQRLALNHANPSRYDWKRNNSICGTHVIAESRIKITDIFPITYSVRENGRQR